jgi:hypothetical protein
MPRVFKIYNKKGGKEILSCCINAKGKAPHCGECGQCTAITSSGKRCKKHTCLDAKLCYLHLREKFFVILARSRIPRSGLGLFCWTSKITNARKNGESPIFKQGDLIVPYGGREITKTELDLLYNYTNKKGKVIESTAPYAVEAERPEHVIDAACVRQAGAYANDSKGTRFHSNADLHSDGLYANKLIYRGDEIFVSYGKQYWDYYKYSYSQTKNVPCYHYQTRLKSKIKSKSKSKSKSKYKKSKSKSKYEKSKSKYKKSKYKKSQKTRSKEKSKLRRRSSSHYNLRGRYVKDGKFIL